MEQWWSNGGLIGGAIKTLDKLFLWVIITVEKLKKEVKKMTRKEAIKIFEQALNDFEKQFGVQLSYTGYENDDDEVFEQEFWVEGLLKTNANIDIKTGGWFSVDYRDNDLSIYCLIGLKINDKLIGECEGFKGWYDITTGKWELDWETY